MADAAVGAEVHEALDIHRHLAPEIALQIIFGGLGPQLVEFRLGQLIDLCAHSQTGRPANKPGAGWPDAINMGQGDIQMLVIGYVDARDTSHKSVSCVCPNPGAVYGAGRNRLPLRCDCAG